LPIQRISVELTHYWYYCNIVRSFRP
jgi:hypothetical protein